MITSLILLTPILLILSSPKSIKSGTVCAFRSSSTSIYTFNGKAGGGGTPGGGGGISVMVVVEVTFSVVLQEDVDVT